MMEPGRGCTSSFLMVDIAGVSCALPVGQVLGVLRRVSITGFPAREPAFLGLARYGNEPIAVLDGALLFGLNARPAAPPLEPVVVVIDGGEDDDSEVFGVLVERAGRIVSLDGEDGQGRGEGVRVCDPRRAIVDRVGEDV